MKCSLMMRRACVGYSIGVLYWVLVGSRMWGTAILSCQACSPVCLAYCTLDLSFKGETACGV